MTVSDIEVSAVIPAYNEAGRIEDIVRGAAPYADEVLVIDDGSTDDTARAAETAGARVFRQGRGGYIAAVKRGFREAAGRVVVTLDGDGEHRPDDIPRLAGPILRDEADLVLGRRRKIARLSERLISRLCRLRLPVHDTGTGLRAMRRDLALRLTLPGRCICGTSVLEARALGARIAEVPICLNRTDKPRRIAWGHVPQVFHVIKMLLQG